MPVLLFPAVTHDRPFPGWRRAGSLAPKPLKFHNKTLPLAATHRNRHV